jgi:hypothetical protein
MKFAASLFLLLLLGSSGNVQASGIIVDTIKSHIEQHQVIPRRDPARQQVPLSSNALEQWVRSLLESLTGSR